MVILLQMSRLKVDECSYCMKKNSLFASCVMADNNKLSIYINCMWGGKGKQCSHSKSFLFIFFCYYLILVVNRGHYDIWHNSGQ